MIITPQNLFEIISISIIPTAIQNNKNPITFFKNKPAYTYSIKYMRNNTI